MALDNAAIDALSVDLKTLAGFLSLHSASPGTTGINETAAARQAAGWVDNGSGVITATNVAFTGGAASGACQYVGLWSASSGGTFYGSWALSGDQTFNASGAYTVTSLTVTGSSS